MLRTLLTRRWILLFFAVLLLGYVCHRLGTWQFHRYAERHDSNQQIRTNVAAQPVPFTTLFSSADGPTEAQEWTSVTASGTYDSSHALAVLYRTRDGEPGVEDVVPLVTSSGEALLVDRGWIATTGGDLTPHLPDPPTGQVTVVGYARRNSSGGGSQVDPTQGSVRAISSSAIAGTVPYQLYDGFVNLEKETPTVKGAPSLPEKPDLSSGPSFFYGLQWNFFALLAVGFYIYFAWAETHPTTPGPRTRAGEVPALKGPS